MIRPIGTSTIKASKANPMMVRVLLVAIAGASTWETNCHQRHVQCQSRDEATSAMMHQAEDGAMRKLISLLTAYTVLLCKMFRVTPESITKDRRGNMPPPSGGIASY